MEPDLHTKAAKQIIRMMETTGMPLTDAQRMMLAGALAIWIPKAQSQFPDEIEQLRADAERYRRLGWLVESGEWDVTKIDYGSVCDTHMDDKANMDRVLDSHEVIANASKIAEWHSVTEEK